MSDVSERHLRVFAAKPKTCSQMKREVKELDHQRQLEIEYRDLDSEIDLTSYKKCDNVCHINDFDDDVMLQIFSRLNDLRDKTVAEFG